MLLDISTFSQRTVLNEHMFVDVQFWASTYTPVNMGFWTSSRNIIGRFGRITLLHAALNDRLPSQCHFRQAHSFGPGASAQMHLKIENSLIAALHAGWNL